MHARVWQLRIRPGKIADFKHALSSLIAPAQQQGGFLGAIALGACRKGSPEVTLIALWETLDAMRASERNMLVTQSISRFMGCCDGLPHIEETEVLAAEFPSAVSPTPWYGRLI